MTPKPISTTKYIIDSDNKLVVSKQVKLDGEWSLTDDHDLSLKLRTTKDSKSGDKIVLGGLIKEVTKNSLHFEVASHTGEEVESAYTIALKGTWQADKYNRLIFKVKKENSQHDILTFKNTWIVNKKHRIIYEYERSHLVYKKKKKQQLILKGYWNLSKDNRLYYELDKENDSRLDFKVGAATFEKNRIKYKIMIGKSNEENTVSIGGSWKVSSDLSVNFEVDYGENEIRAISLGGKWDLSDDTTIGLKLNNGAEIKLDHEWLGGDANAFVKYKQSFPVTERSRSDNKVDWGIGLKW